ncbi:ABC transporter permease [Anaerocolumna sp.]|uniref:ABC transporter permease n=1 Tax=Anaerocolumna sp. TaxID=2041569 RepID=UPI0028AB1B67|nr:ABC transporter permease [Anaerocolumna sp.]
MFAKMYIKEIKQFFRKPFNILFMLVVPICLILLMGYAMSNIVGRTESNINTDSTVLYIVESGSNEQYQQNFKQFKSYVNKSMNIKFIEIHDFNSGCEDVNKQNAIALIQLSDNGFYYYRSPYNEPAESKILRAAYKNILGRTENLESNSIEMVEVKQKTINSYTYFTFAELGLIIMYLSLIVGQSIFIEKETKTFERIYISKANINKTLISKVALGCTIGLLQILLVYLVSSLILNISWGKYFILIYALYLLLSLLSSTLGAIMGLFIQKKAVLNDSILIISISFGLLGGGLTPLSFLDSIKIVSFICKLSPLYWITNSAISLSSGKINTEFVIAVILCLLIIIFMVLIYSILKKAEKIKGVYLYE